MPTGATGVSEEVFRRKMHPPMGADRGFVHSEIEAVVRKVRLAGDNSDEM